MASFENLGRSCASMRPQTTKPSELRFRAVLDSDIQEVCFARVTQNESRWRSARSNADDSELKGEMATQVGSALVETTRQPEKCTRKRLGALSEARWWGSGLGAKVSGKCECGNDEGIAR